LLNERGRNALVERSEPEALWRERRRSRATRIEHLLRDAQRAIPLPHHVPDENETRPVIWGELTGTLDEFEEFFYHNEYELAWKTLIAVARRTPPASTCWTLLAEAAMLVRKYERFDSYFMSLVRYAVTTSPDLRGAIEALPQRLKDANDRTEAEQLASRLAEER